MSENYYILLGLSPEIDDWAFIEPAIMDCQRRWAMQKNQGSPADRRKAERHLKLIPKMRGSLKDPKERKSVAKEAEQELKSQKKEQLVKLDELIGTIQGVVIEPEEVKLLVRHTGLTEADVTAHLKIKGITLTYPASSKEKSSIIRPKLDRTIAQSIRDNLQHLGLKNLYEFLGLGMRSSPSVLYSTADEVYKELRRKGQSDPDSTSRQELAGHAKAVFKDKLGKERYDNTYAVEAMESLKELLEFTGRKSILDQNNMDRLVSEARKKGVEQSMALEYVEDYAKKRKWLIQGNLQLSSVELKQCGFCNTIARASKDTRCHNCGQELVQACPRCGQLTQTQDECCGACGCSTGDAPFIQGLLKEGRTHVAQGDLPMALRCFKEALIYWENWQPALKEIQRIELIRHAREFAFDSVEQLLKQRKLEEAQNKLEGLKREFGLAGTKDLEARIDTGIKQAKSAFRTAEALIASGRKEDAIEKLTESLSHCRDFQPALSTLATSPPPAPSKLTVEIKGSIAQLRWHPCQSKGDVTYTIQRKSLGVPGNSNDGIRLKEVSTCEYHDTSITPGTPWYYSVFAARGSIASVKAASSGPHMLVADPTAIIVKSSDQQVSIKWTPPEGCKHIEIWRRENTPPSAPRDGVKVTISGNSAVDQGLENGAEYGYLLVACFDDPVDGQQLLYSPGIRLVAKPVAPPVAVEDLHARREGSTIRLNWTPVSRGNVQIRQTRQVMQVSIGEILPLSEAEQYGDPVTITGSGMAQARLSSQGRVFFIPLSVIEQTAVLGKPVTITTLDEVTDVKTRREGDRILLTWAWPSGASEVFVGWRNDDYPQSPEAANAGGQLVTQKEYDREGLWVLRKAPRVRHYFTLFVRDSKSEIYSSGTGILDANGLEARVMYRVVKRYSRFRRILQESWIALETDGSIGSLPGLRVVVKQGSPPIRPENGRVLLKLDHIDFDMGMARINLPEDEVNGYIKLFFENGLEARELRLIPADQEQLRLG